MILYQSSFFIAATDKGFLGSLTADEKILLIVFSLWMLLVLGIGFYTSRFAKSTAGFFLGDRKMGAWLTAISSTASSESGWLLLGAVGMAYMMGASAVWIAVGCLCGYAFNWFLFAEKFRKGTKNLDSITIPDYLEDYVKDKSHIIRITGVIIIILLMFTYVAAQMTAAGKSLNAIFGLDYTWGVIISGLVTVLYTMMGGYRAVTWTDLVQGLLMVVALVAMPIVAIFYLGGPAQTVHKLLQTPAGKAGIFRIEGKTTRDFRVEWARVYLCRGEDNFRYQNTLDNRYWLMEISREDVADKDESVFYLRLHKDFTNVYLNDRKLTRGTHLIEKGDKIFLPDEKIKITFENTFVLKGGKDLLSAFGGRTGLGMLGFVLGMLGIGLGYPGSPHVITRYMSAKSGKEIRQGRLIAMTWGVLAMYGAIFLGMAARVLLPMIIDPEYSILIVGKTLLHPILAGIVLSAVISAILSTADSQLLVAASAVTRDIYEKVISKKRVPEEKMVRISRITILIMGILAVLLALTKSRIVFWFVLFSWAGLGASFGPVLILSVFWNKLNKWGMFSGMVTGFAMTLIWKLKLKAWLAGLTGFELYELVPAFFLSLLVAVVVSMVSRDMEEEM